MKNVVVLGGGVAGMSAAHELVERGFDVTVYESKPVPGGKARSIPVPGSGSNGRKDLPGEHGFRFFPRFYKHLPDTMTRIPYGNGGNVSQNLVETTRIAMALYDLPSVVTISKFPENKSDVETVLKAMAATYTGVTQEDALFFAGKLWQILTSCKERRIAEYEKMSWWKFIDAESRSEPYQKYFGHGITRSLVAAKADKASTRTMGDITLQMFLDIVKPGVSADRLLNGPTDDVWIMPWLDYLTSKGVDYRFDSPVTSIRCDGSRIVGATVLENGKEIEVTGDYYIAAMPVEVFAPMISPEMVAADPTLGAVVTLAENVEWMNGIQFYLTKDAPITHGHVIYIDSQWALTSVSQHQFWADVDLSTFGDGTVTGILSVDVSDWNTPGLNGLTARECTREEVAEEVWAQLKKSLNVDGVEPLTDAHRHSWFLDPDIVCAEGAREVVMSNREPLLVNLIDTWNMRPEASTQIPNLFLASDYVRTNTDLATMEAANEAARRAVNGIIAASGADCKNCEIWDLHEPDILFPWRAYDYSRFKKGLPWDGEIHLELHIGSKSPSA